MKTLTLVLLTGLLVIAHKGLAQNQVPNPGFEQCIDCSIDPDHLYSSYLIGTSLDTFPNVLGWARPTGLTVNFFHSSIPSQATCHHYYPRSGAGFMMISAFHDLPPNTPFLSGRSYIQSRLAAPLDSGCIYQVSFYIRPIRNTCNGELLVVDGMGAYLSAQRPFDTLTFEYLPFIPQISNPAGNILADTGNFTLISGSYTAVGGEEYLTIGNFLHDSLVQYIRVINNSNGATSASYIIDDVSVTPLQTTSLTLNLGPDLIYCSAPAPITLTAQPGFDGYLWSTGQTTQAITVTQPGSYWVKADFGCGVLVDTVQVQHYPLSPYLPLLSYSDTTLCQGTQLQLNATPNLSFYSWSSGQATAEITLTQPGTYTLSATSPEGCALPDAQVQVHELLPPTPPVVVQDSVPCSGQPVALRVVPEPGLSYTWSTGSTAAMVLVQQPGSYSLSAENRCGTATTNWPLVLRDCSAIAVPNIVTPNADGLNDTWQLHTEDGRALEVEIFSRWGQRVFRSTAYTGNWPDKRDLPAGLYFYLLHDPLTGKSHKGWVELVR